MKQQTIILSLLLVVFLVFTGFTGGDEKADKVLKGSKAKMETLKDFSAEILYEISSPRSRSISKTLKVKYKKENKYVILMEDQEIYCDGTKLWLYIPDEEVTILNYDPEDELMSLETILGVYEANSVSRYDGMEKVHGVNCHKIFLAVKDASLDYNQAMVWVNSSTQLLEKVSLIDRKQTQTTYELSNIKTNMGMPDSDFRFDHKKYPDIPVYDETE